MMTDDLERLIQAEIADEADHLAGVESAVWTRIQNRQARIGLKRVQGLALALSLIIGLTNGSLIMLAPQPEPSEMSVFAIPAALSPLSSAAVR